MSDAKVTITVKNNGPIRIEGEGFQIKDAQGNVFGLGGRNAVSLCRCGASKKQPFCDGAHSDCKFVSEVAAYDLPVKGSGN
jgi:CDGSH-type Zn-finger protein